MNKPKKILSDSRDILQTLLNRAESSYPDRAHMIWNIWPTAVGPDLSNRCFPLSLRKGKLLVGVTSAPWMQQLVFFKEDLRNSINKSLDHELVQEIRFKLSEPPEKPRERKPVEDPPWLQEKIPKSIAASIKSDLSAIPDPKIRKMVYRARMRWEQMRRFREDQEDA